MSTAQCKIYPLVTKVLFDGRTWMHCLRTVRMSLPLPEGEPWAVSGRFVNRPKPLTTSVGGGDLDVLVILEYKITSP